MKRPRRNHSPEFKARVAREAMGGVKTVAEIAREHDLHPVQVSAWKAEAEAGMPGLFERKGARDARVRELEDRCGHMERLLGQVTVEKDFLKKKCSQLGIGS